MKPKQNKNYIVGIYARLSRDDERAGESLSIENQKTMLTKYVRDKVGRYMTFTLTTVYRERRLNAKACKDY